MKYLSETIVPMDKVVCRESYGSTAVRKSFVRTTDDELRVVKLTERFTSISQFFRSVFLPQGYPASVSDDYLQYQIWDTIQAFCSGITGSLATQAVLKGVGVGDESATVLAATVTWLMKDGTGMVGRIVFAWMQGSYLDCDCKRWRLYADILNDVAILLDICAPLFQSYFTIIVCISGLCRSLVGVAGGATRAALTQHQARRNNMADVSAKDGSQVCALQETLVNLAALICNLLLLPLVTGHSWLVWTLFLLFTALHIFANYRAVTCVTMESFNQSRLHIVSQHFLSTGGHQVLRVKAANLQEPVLWKTRRRLSIHLGVSLSHILHSYDDLCRLTSIFTSARYLLQVSLKSGRVYIVLHKDCTSLDILEAVFNAEVVEFALLHSTLPPVQKGLSPDDILLHKVVEAATHGDELSLMSLSRSYTHSTFPSFIKHCENAGWLTSYNLLSADEWRAVWGKEAEQWTDKKLY